MKKHSKSQVSKNHLVSLQSVNINLTTPVKKKIRRRKPRQVQLQAVVPQQQAPMPNLPLLPNTLNQYLTGVPQVPFNATALPSGINFPIAFPNTFSRDTGVLFNNAPSQSLNDISAEMAQIPSEVNQQSELPAVNSYSSYSNKQLNEIADMITAKYGLIRNPIKRLSKANKISWFIDNGYENYLE